MPLAGSVSSHGARAPPKATRCHWAALGWKKPAHCNCRLLAQCELCDADHIWDGRSVLTVPTTISCTREGAASRVQHRKRRVVFVSRHTDLADPLSGANTCGHSLRPLRCAGATLFARARNCKREVNQIVSGPIASSVFSTDGKIMVLSFINFRPTCIEG
jgi:hypothetical protein